MNTQDALIQGLGKLHLSPHEARIYLELLRGPSSHLRLAHATGINRTKVYRIADQLEKRSLVTRRTDDRGTFLVAADPATLEVGLVSQEEQVKEERATLNQILPQLSALREGETSKFVVHTYEGEDGFKQMLWHELKANKEVLIFGSGTIEDLVGDSRWAEKHRAATIGANYQVRELLNPGRKKPVFTLQPEFMKHWAHRLLPTDVLDFTNQTVIYNDTVAVYHWHNNQKVGTEIINTNYAAMLRQMFRHYWELAAQYQGLQP